MGFFLLQIFLPALAFAQDSSSFNVTDGPNDADETEEVDGRAPVLAVLSVIFVVLLGCLYCTYQNNDGDTEVPNPQSWVSIRLNIFTVWTLFYKAYAVYSLCNILYSIY